MDSHQPTFDGALDQQLDLRVLRFRNEPEREDPALLVLELVSAGRTHDAIEVVDAALRAEPDDVDLLLGCGIAAMRAEQLAFAQLVLTRAARQAPAWSEPLRVLSSVLSMRGRPEKAVEIARRALELGATDAELQQRVQRDDRERALDAQLESFRADPTSIEPALLAQELLAQERTRDALEVIESALSIEEDADLHVIAARIQRSRGERELARAALARAIALTPDWAEPARMLGELLLDEGALLEALPIIESALARHLEDASLVELRLRLEDAMRDAGITRPESTDAGLDELLSTLDRIDPIGDETRRAISRPDTLVDVASPAFDDDRPRRRSGWLPTIARTLFGGSRAPIPARRDVARA